MKLCKHCGEKFEPESTRFKYCSKTCRAKHDVDAKREWRKVVRQVSGQITPADGEEYRRTKARRWVHIKDAEIWHDVSTGELTLVSDTLWRYGESRQGLEDVSGYRSMSGSYAYLIDARIVKALDRLAHGLPAEFNPPEREFDPRVVRLVPTSELLPGGFKFWDRLMREVSLCPACSLEPVPARPSSGAPDPGLSAGCMPSDAMRSPPPRG